MKFSSTILACKQCKSEAQLTQLRQCHFCGIVVHAACIAPLIAAITSCSCNLGFIFVSPTKKSSKRGHFELSSTMSMDDETPPIPEPVPFSHFFKDLDDKSTMVDVIRAFGSYLDKKQEHDDIKDAHGSAAIGTLKTTVESNSNDILRLKKKTERHDASLVLFELSVTGIHGENLTELRENFLQICSFLKVDAERLDIANLRYLKRDRSNKKVKSHSVAIHLHSSKRVSTILEARKQGNKKKQLKPVDMFPSLPASGRFIHI